MDRRGLGALLLALGCGAPVDPSPTRPVAVEATPFAQHDVVVQGLRLRTLDEGPGDPAAPPLVVLPGHTARIEDYDSLVPLLSDRFRVLLPDLPGKGYSDKPDRRYSFAFYREILAGYLDVLGVERAHLAGGSLGGNLALRMARHHPDRVSGVVAWGPGSAWEARPGLARVIRAIGVYPLFWPAIRVHSRFWFREDNPERERLLEEKFAYYREVMGPGFFRMYVDMAADSVGSSLFDLAPEIPHPVLLIRGALDDGGGLEAGIARLDALLPRSRRVEIPGARHALTSEAPAALASHIRAFLSDGVADPATDGATDPARDRPPRGPSG